MRISRINSDALVRCALVVTAVAVTLSAGVVVAENRLTLVTIIVGGLLLAPLLLHLEYALMLFPIAFFFDLQVPLLGFSPEKLLTVFVLGVWLAQRVIGRNDLDRSDIFPNELSLLFGVYLMACAFSLFHTSSLRRGIIDIQSLLGKGVLVYLVYRLVDSSRKLRLCIYGLLVLTVMIGAAVLATVIMTGNIQALRARFLPGGGIGFLNESTIVRSATRVGEVAIVILPVTLVVLLLSRKLGARILAILALLLSIGTAFLSISRASYIAIAVQLAWLFVRNQRFASKMLPVAVLVVLAILVVLTPPVYERFAFLIEGRDTLTDLSAGYRVGVHRMGMQIVLNHPLLGLGLGSFEERSQAYADLMPVEVEVGAAHSSLLEIAAETGFLGLIPFIGLLIAFLRRVRRSAIPVEGFGDQLSALFEALFLGVLVNSLFHNTILGVNLIWYVAGLGLRLGNLGQVEGNGA